MAASANDGNDPAANHGDGADGARTLNLLVIVSLFAMLAGSVLLIGSLETEEFEVPPMTNETVFQYRAPAWDPFEHPMEVKVFGPGNISFHASVEGATGARAGLEEGGNRTLGNQSVFVWWEDAQPRETWTVNIENAGSDPLRVATRVSCDSYYIVGGILVGFGLLGFVFYRLGMSK